MTRDPIGGPTAAQVAITSQLGDLRPELPIALNVTFTEPLVIPDAPDDGPRKEGTSVQQITRGTVLEQATSAADRLRLVDSGLPASAVPYKPHQGTREAARRARRSKT